MSEASIHERLATDISALVDIREREEAERARFIETCELVASCGDNEAKGLTLLTLWAEGGYLSRQSLHNSFVARQGDSPTWTPNHNLAFNYCVQSLEPIGAVVQGNVPKKVGSGLTSAYSISSKGIEAGVPVVGLVLDCSIQHPEISLQQVFGATSTNAERRSPETRANLFLDLLTNPNGEKGVAVGEVDGLTYVHPNKYQETIEVLEKQGLVRKESASEFNDRRYRATYISSQSGRSLSDRSQVFYEFLATKKPGDTFTHQEALEYCIEAFAQHGLEADPARVRDFLRVSLGGKKRFPEVERLGTYNRGLITRVFPIEEYSEPIMDLFNIVLAINAGDPVALEKGRKAAARIISNPELVAQLMEKSYAFSSHTRANRERTISDLLGIVIASDVVIDAEGVLEIYDSEDNPPISLAIVRRYLNQLCENGELEVSHERKIESRRNKRNYYQAKK